MHTTEVKYVETERGRLHDEVTYERDFFKAKLDEVIAAGADGLDPMRNWYEGRYQSYAKVLDLMGQFE
jgi:hypothetical protein